MLPAITLYKNDFFIKFVDPFLHYLNNVKKGTKYEQKIIFIQG